MSSKLINDQISENQSEQNASGSDPSGRELHGADISNDSLGRQSREENKMGVMPENRLLISMAWPMMLSMLVQALYNVVDTMFVSRITTSEKVYDSAGNFVSAGTDAISALGFAFPIQMIIISLAVGTGVGVNALLSRALGEKNQKVVDKTAANAIFLMFMSYLISLFIGIFLSHVLIKGQGAFGRQLEYGTTYLTIVCCFSIMVYMEIMLERLLQATGRTFLSMIPQVTGAVINCIMDPMLIFGIGPFPEMGVAGAAVATVFGQMAATIIGLNFNLKKNPDINFRWKYLKPDLGIIKRIYTVGLPAIIMQGIGSIMNFGMNSVIHSLNQNAVAVFTVYYKLQSFFFMPTFGLSNAMVPIVAYNFGARKKNRMLKTLKLAELYGFLMLFLGFLCFEIIPDKLLMIFDTGDSSLITIGVPALRVIGIHYLIAWFSIITINFLQALGNGIYSMTVSICRQLAVLLPAAYILGRIGGINMLWWSFPIAEVISASLTFIFFRHMKRTVVDKIK
ncbi:MAG: MATE family efflux transporter [Lachnospiraceae bacterium]|jgi:putative MATE family efflux protein|nr:MATE family efflux transporter [Lachnospiraceae bacterium]